MIAIKGIPKILIEFLLGKVLEILPEGFVLNNKKRATNITTTSVSHRNAVKSSN
jgi:hypothetical protein